MTRSKKQNAIARSNVKMKHKTMAHIL